jgi:paraquat-inducible protein A
VYDDIQRLNRRSAAQRGRMRRTVAGVLLLLALAANIAALFLPFVHVGIGLQGHDYSLLHTVDLLWSYGFPILAVVVCGFSVVFPFAKIAVLGAVHQGRLDARWAVTIGGLGKWSMLDLFLVVLLLVVAYDRLLVSAEPQPGLPCFAVAVLLAMVAGELLHAPVEQDPTTQRGTRSRLLLGATVIGTGLALTLPLFATDAWFLADHTYSILGMVGLLAKSHALIPAAITLLFLIITPLLRLGCLILAAKQGGRWPEHAATLGRWAMLEPFALAVAIFVVEGKSQIPTTLLQGSIVLILAILGSSLASWFLIRPR